MRAVRLESGQAAMVPDRCEIPRCRRISGFTYLGKALCWNCWQKFTAEGLPHDALKEALKINEETDDDSGRTAGNDAQTDPGHP